MNFFLRCFRLPPDLQDSAFAIFVAWEKLRILYNVVLVFATLVSVILMVALNVGMNGVAALMVLPTILFGAVGANVAYCVGPIAEGYLVMLMKVDRNLARIILFTLGCIAGVLLTFLAIGMSVASAQFGAGM